MRFAHISDMHLGLALNGYSFLEDQKYIMDQMSDIILKNNVDAVFISGDIYDKPFPPEEAVSIFDRFISEISNAGKYIYVIPGNHDSAVRLSFGADILKGQNVYIAKAYNGNVEKYTFEDEYGEIGIFLLPFIKPVDVRSFFPDKEINDNFNKMMRAVLENVDANFQKRNIILSHQFLQGSKRADNGKVITGMYDAINPEVYDGFDYVAMGHLHNEQYVEDGRIRYCGTPLKYSKFESNCRKSITFGEIREKGDLTLWDEELSPMKDMRVISGTFDEIKDIKTDDYVHIVLKGPDNDPDMYSTLRDNLPNIMSYTCSDNFAQAEPDNMIENDTLLYFEEFFAQRMGRDLNEKERTILLNLIN